MSALLACLAVAMLGASAQGKPSLYSYMTDGGSSIATLDVGQTHFHQVSSSDPNRYIDATVDYAIFAPSVYSGASLDFEPFPSFDELSDSDYVYAYQLHNSEGSIYLISFTMPRVSGIDIDEYNFGYSDPCEGPFSGEVNWTDISIAGSVIQMRFLLDPNLLPPGKSSYVILIACPYYADISKPVTVADGGLSSQRDMPVPAVIPAPGALALAVVGVVFIRRLRWRLS